MPKGLCLAEAEGSPLFSRHKGGEWRFCKGRPGVDLIASRNRKDGDDLGQGRPAGAREALTFLQRRQSSQSQPEQGRLGRCAAAGSTQILRIKGQSGGHRNQREPEYAKKSRRRWAVQRSDRTRRVGQESMSCVIESLPVCASDWVVSCLGFCRRMSQKWPCLQSQKSKVNKKLWIYLVRPGPGQVGGAECNQKDVGGRSREQV